MRRYFFLAAVAVLTSSSPLQAAPAASAASTVVRLEKALSVVGDAPALPGNPAAMPVNLPDRWSVTHPDHDGIMWYLTAFRFAESVLPDDMLVLDVEQACSDVQVLLNGRLIFSSGRM